MLPRPFLISTSCHVAQGILEVKAEAWNESARSLTGTSAVVAEDVYELRVVARTPDAVWSLAKAEVSADDAAAGVTITASGANGLVRAVIKSPVSRDVAWNLRFMPGTAAAGPPAKLEDVSWTPLGDGGAVQLRWKPVDGVEGEVIVGQNPPILSGTGACILSGLAPGQEQRVRLTAVSWSGHRGASTEMTVTLPKAPELPPLPPKPTVSLSSLKAVEARTGYGSVNANASADGKPLTLGGTVYSSGVGVHAESVLVYEVKPDYRRFVAVVGIDDEKKDSVASVLFRVIAEIGGQKKELAASPTLRARRPPAKWHFDVAIPDQCTRLRLVVEDAGDGINSDHADWADAGFVTGSR
jgi:hypothetical protein